MILTHLLQNTFINVMQILVVILSRKTANSIGLNGKFLRVSNEKSIIFLIYIYTIFNQLYN
jgi:hypothetical protein